MYLIPQSLLSTHIILSGAVTNVNEMEMNFARHSLFIQYPEMKTWPSSHNWLFAKVSLTSVWILDHFGGPKVVTPENSRMSHFSEIECSRFNNTNELA